jgi:hypothetical protein
MRFYKTIRETIESKLQDPDVTLNSFILSTTPFTEIKHWKGQESMEGFNDKHVFFMREQKAFYIKSMIDKIISS